MSKDILDGDGRGEQKSKGSQVGFGRNIEEFLCSISSNGGSDVVNNGEKGICILSLTNAGTSRVRVRVLVENPSGREEYEFILLEEFCRELSVGEISGDRISEIEYYSQVTEGFDSACASFGYIQSSLSSLKRKLLQKGYGQDIAVAAINVLESRGVVDERKIALNRAKVFLDKHWGRSRIFSKLREEGFPDSALEAVRDELDEVDFSSMCATVIRRKFGVVPEERREREKMFASLSRFGYSGSDIKEALKIIKNIE